MIPDFEMMIEKILPKQEEVITGTDREVLWIVLIMCWLHDVAYVNNFLKIYSNKTINYL
jgi:hypothetical protein